MEIVMSFDPDGSVEYTRNKALDGIFGGQGRMKRVTDIQKLNGESLFFIKWLMGPYAGKHFSHTLDRHDEVFGLWRPSQRVFISSHTGTMFFYSYEDAVAYEIECLNEMRRQGITFDVEETKPSRA